MTDPTDAELRALCEMPMRFDMWRGQSDAEFIAAARTALPRLLDERDALALHNDGLQGVHADLIRSAVAALADWRTVAEALAPFGVASGYFVAKSGAGHEHMVHPGLTIGELRAAAAALAIAEKHANKEGGDPHKPGFHSGPHNAKPAPDALGERAPEIDWDDPGVEHGYIPRGCEVTKDQIKHMVDRFLNWKLPTPWNPDGGISFEPLGNEGTAHQYERQPVGTNLFDHDQATAMVKYMVEGLPALLADWRQVAEALRLADSEMLRWTPSNKWTDADRAVFRAALAIAEKYANKEGGAK